MSRSTTTDDTSAVPPGRLVLDYRLSDEVVIGDEDATRHVERWTVTVTDGDGDPVGEARVIILNLDGDLEFADLTDAATGTWIEPVVRTGVSGGAADALGGHVLVLDRVFIQPSRRGSGLGPIVAALAIGRLRRGCRVAVCFPAPFDGPHTDDDRDRSITALGRIWETVGFRPRADGVWILDLEADTLALATHGLLAAAGRRRPLNVEQRRGDAR
jgi:hypothetical protein